MWGFLEFSLRVLRSDQSEVGGERRERSGSPQPGIQAQRPRTRTARTTRQINGAISVQWLGRFWRNVFRSGPATRPTSIGPKHVFVDLSKGKQWFWKVHGKAHDILVEKRLGFNTFLNL